MRPVLSALVMVMGRALSICEMAAHFEAAADMEGAGEHEAMADVFAGGAVVAGTEGIELSGLRAALQRADAVDVVEEFAEQAAPGLRFRELIVRDQAEEAHIALQVEHEGVVAGAIVGLKHVDVGHDVGLIGGVVGVRRGNERGEEIGAAGVGEGAIAVVALLVDVVGAGQPVLIEGVLGAAGDVNGVGRLVGGTDEVAGGAGAALQAAGAGERVSAGAAGESASYRVVALVLLTP